MDIKFYYNLSVIAITIIVLYLIYKGVLFQIKMIMPV